MKRIVRINTIRPRMRKRFFWYEVEPNGPDEYTGQQHFESRKDYATESTPERGVGLGPVRKLELQAS
jgi:hypothetical protein